MSKDDANHILASTDILVFRVALQKALFGLIGFAALLLLAVLTFLQIQKRPQGSFSLIWIDRNLHQTNTQTQQLWKNRLLDLCPALPFAILLLIHQRDFLKVRKGRAREPIRWDCVVVVQCSSRAF